MSDGNGGSGGGGGVRDGGDARDVAPREPQSRGSLALRTPAPSPGWPTVAAAAAGGEAEETAGSWQETRPPGFSTSAVCCGCTAEGAGGGRASGPDVVSGIHPDLRDPRRCAAAEAGGSRGIWPICRLHRRSPRLCRFPLAT